MTTCSRCGKLLAPESIHTCSPQVRPATTNPPETGTGLVVGAPSSGWLTMSEAQAVEMGGTVDPDKPEDVRAAAWCIEAYAQRRAKEEWEKTAQHFYRGMDFCRAQVTRVGKALGPAAYTSDDGSVQQDVLALKVPELVESLLRANEKAEDHLRNAVRRAAALRQIAEEAIAEIENVERAWHYHAKAHDPEWCSRYRPGDTLTALRARLAEIVGAS